MLVWIVLMTSNGNNSLDSTMRMTLSSLSRLMPSYPTAMNI